jgi:hypothetical protein
MIRLDMRGSRGAATIAACVVLGALGLGLPGPAWSVPHRPSRQRVVNSELTGPLLIAWRGDPAHGCAGAGLCGVTGTLQMHLGGASASSSGGAPQLIANDDGAVARVQTTQPDGSVTTCADLVPVQFDFGLGRAGGRLAAEISTAFGSGQTPSSGRCAGPTSGDMAKLALPARRVASGYDFSGHSSFTAGPFAVTVISGVRGRITFGSQGGGAGGSDISVVSGTTVPVKPHSALVERASFTYRVSGFSGVLNTDFAGLTPPQCDALGACGVTGRLVQAFAAHGSLTFMGARIATRRAGRDRALADLRHGDMPLSDTFAEQAVHESVAETSAQTGGLACAATSSIALAGALASRPRRGSDKLELSDPVDGFGGGPLDAFRTPCPGPSAQDILGPGGGAMATATVAARRLGAGHLSIVFRSRGSFDSSAYTGRRSGVLVLGLVLVRRSGGTRRVRLFDGEPLNP